MSASTSERMGRSFAGKRKLAHRRTKLRRDDRYGLVGW